MARKNHAANLTELLLQYPDAHTRLVTTYLMEYAED